MEYNDITWKFATPVPYSEWKYPIKNESLGTEMPLYVKLNGSGKFSYNVEESAKYKICIYSSDKDLFKKKKFLKVQFNIQSSDELFDANSAKLKDFQKVNDTMQKLNSKIDSIEEMQNYQIQVEDNFSKNQVLSSSRVALITIFQIFIIIIVGTYQVFSLRKVFKDKIWAPF